MRGPALRVSLSPHESVTRRAGAREPQHGPRTARPTRGTSSLGLGRKHRVTPAAPPPTERDAGARGALARGSTTQYRSSGRGTGRGMIREKEGGLSFGGGIKVRAGLQLGTPSSCRGCMPTAAAQRERGIVCRWLRAFRVPRASRDSPDPRGSTKALEGAQDSQKGMPALFAPLVPPGLGASMVSTSDTFMAPVVLGGRGAAPHGGCVSKRCRRSL